MSLLHESGSLVSSEGTTLGHNVLERKNSVDQSIEVEAGDSLGGGEVSSHGGHNIDILGQGIGGDVEAGHDEVSVSTGAGFSGLGLKIEFFEVGRSQGQGEEASYDDHSFHIYYNLIKMRRQSWN